jgi:hypothetical protein
VILDPVFVAALEEQARDIRMSPAELKIALIDAAKI